ncbi:hypothetical protein D4R52_03500 [bacterium]|nr:MAG: hypothetical protein D4R52_03500 [bacterium]
MPESTKKDIEQILGEKFEEQAQLINNSFQAQKGDFDIVKNDLDKVKEDLGEVKVELDKVKVDMGEVKDTMRVIEAKVNKALNIEYARLEKRMKVVEQKLGIAAPAGNSD